MLGENYLEANVQNDLPGDMLGDMLNGRDCGNGQKKNKVRGIWRISFVNCLGRSAILFRYVLVDMLGQYSPA